VLDLQVKAWQWAHIEWLGGNSACFKCKILAASQSHYYICLEWIEINVTSRPRTLKNSGVRPSECIKMLSFSERKSSEQATDNR
jgi:hypothetical protein